ncbi:hypothetical protein CP532_2475 [Ophiocordyceps camponoti-leonardi (nom. inval.)]|nr:hypothetical protein CP532_2475 [Ophiocordyceps camponoti-leonardi (nom. inval.)]
MRHSPPAYLFVVRHGNRLDAADKTWHLSSPTPYDTPLTYGGFLQARLVGSQIASTLEQAKLDAQTTKPNKRFKVVIHSSPFLRCVQTSVGISAGLAQRSPDSAFNPCDVVVPRAPSSGHSHRSRSALLRLDAFLGEWLSPEYFETITAPPGPALLLGGAKADLLRREDYSAYVDVSPTAIDTPSTTTSGSLWQPSHVSSPASEGPASLTALSTMSAMSSSLPALDDDDDDDDSSSAAYLPPRPLYAVSSSGEIPEGIVAHARDACVTVDYQWDSMRKPLDFGDGGKVGEEWTAMHKRFRAGLTKLLNWYATTDAPADLVAGKPDPSSEADGGRDEDVETVVVIVSHGAGCNALIGAITHQPVLMDVGIASITMASRKPDVDYGRLRADAGAGAGAEAEADADALVPVDLMYDLRQSASTEHLHSTSSTPVSSRPASSRSASVSHARNSSATHGIANRGRTSTLGAAVLSPISFHNQNYHHHHNHNHHNHGDAPMSAPMSAPIDRSVSTSAVVVDDKPARSDTIFGRPETTLGEPDAALDKADAVFDSEPPRRDASVPRRPVLRGPVMSMPGAPRSLGLWSPAPSSLRLMDDGGDDDDDDDDFESMMPDFERRRFSDQTPEAKKETAADEASPTSEADEGESMGHWLGGPVFAAPITLRTDMMAPSRSSMMDEVRMSQFGGGLGGLWGVPSLADEVDRFHDLGHRRWKMDERV